MKINIKKILAIVIVLLVIATLGYFAKIRLNQMQAIQNISDKPQIVTSFYPLYFFTSQIALEKADVYNITPAGAEPHDYEPSTQDMAKIENSNMLVLNG